MDIYREKLLLFRDLQITKDDLLKTIPRQPKPGYQPVAISNIDLIKLLDEYKRGIRDEQFILNWVNTIWFTDWYTYENKYSDSIASVMNELEEIDEEGKGLTIQKVERYISALEKNIEV